MGRGIPQSQIWQVCWATIHKCHHTLSQRYFICQIVLPVSVFLVYEEHPNPADFGNDLSNHQHLTSKLETPCIDSTGTQL